MLDPKIISRLAEIVEKSNLTEFEYEDEGCRISMSKHHPHPAAPLPPFGPAPVPAPLPQAAPAQIAAPAAAPAAPAPGVPATPPAMPQAVPSGMPEMPGYPGYPTYPYPYPPYPMYPPQAPAAPPDPKVVNAQPNRLKELSSETQLNQEQRDNLDLILSVSLEVAVEIGRTRRKIQDILSFSKGSLVVLDKLAGDQVDLLVNGQCVAKGDVVVIDDNFGIRITEILQKPDINVLTQG